jgi:2-methylisocitrate lyase-like PEP mutase family enzyme
VPALEGPLNLISIPGLPTIPELERLGVARLSVGGRLTLGAMSGLKKSVTELLGNGTYESTFEGAIGYPDANRLMAGRRT